MAVGVLAAVGGPGRGRGLRGWARGLRWRRVLPARPLPSSRLAALGLHRGGGRRLPHGSTSAQVSHLATPPHNGVIRRGGRGSGCEKPLRFSPRIRVCSLTAAIFKLISILFFNGSGQNTIGVGQIIKCGPALAPPILAVAQRATDCPLLADWLGRFSAPSSRPSLVLSGQALWTHRKHTNQSITSASLYNYGRTDHSTQLQPF